MPTITTRYMGDMLFESQMGNHRLITDVPAAMGGSDRGPTPPQVFIASLGSCIGAFVASYCKHTEIDMQDMAIEVTFDKADNPTRLTNISVTINIPNGNGACAQREEVLRRVAEHCPIHETITTFEGIQIKFAEQPVEAEPVAV
jgi:uncharacterized OsmC-like protein